MTQPRQPEILAWTDEDGDTATFTNDSETLGSTGHLCAISIQGGEGEPEVAVYVT